LGVHLPGNATFVSTQYSSSWDCDAEMAGRPQKPNARGDYELMLSATKTRVPFTLP
jgi:hypothetical protein